MTWRKTTAAAGIIAMLTTGQPLLLRRVVQNRATAVLQCVMSMPANIAPILDGLRTREPISPNAVPELQALGVVMADRIERITQMYEHLRDLGPEDDWSGITVLNAPQNALELWHDNNACVNIGWDAYSGYQMLHFYTRPRQAPRQEKEKENSLPGFNPTP